jgi:putative PIN family toxin of toxin-antitoxin system
MTQIALDTNVLAAALKSRNGASFRLLSLVGPSAPFKCKLSVPLVLEYEAALTRQLGVGDARVGHVIDYLCSVSDLREIYFLWRPFLRDPGDDMVLELAVESGADVIVTHNIRDFQQVEERFGIRIVTPGGFLLDLEDIQ